jgi:hypothetical protein
MFLDTLCRDRSEILYEHSLWSEFATKNGNKHFGWRLFKQCVGKTSKAI